MPSAVPPEAMTPAERLAEVAAILARGVLRLRLRGVLAVSETPPKGLDPRRKTSPHVTSTVNDHGDLERQGGRR